MALITCPDCGKQVSDTAPACPGCGRPFAPQMPQVGQYGSPPQHSPPATWQQQGVPTAGVRASSSVIRLRVGAILGIACGTFAGCGGMAAQSSVAMGVGTTIFVAGLICYVAARVIQV